MYELLLKINKQKKNRQYILAIEINILFRDEAWHIHQSSFTG